MNAKRLVLALCCVNLGCGSLLTHNSGNVHLSSGGVVDALTVEQRAKQVSGVYDDLDRLGRTLVEDGVVPGVAAALVLDKKVLWWRGWGASNLIAHSPVDQNTVFRIASITKTLTALAILKLRDEGRLRLDDPLSATLPEIKKVLMPVSDAPAIRLRHLLTHTSGLPKVGSMDYWSRPDEDLSEAEILGGLHGLKLLSAPGVEERYSNLGAALLGIVISRVSGVSYSKYISDNLLAPLKMSRSAWSFQGASKHGMARGYLRDKDGKWREGHHWRLGAGSAMGGLYAPLKDMARYLIFQLDAWPPRSSPDNGPLKRSTVRESQLVLGFGHPGHVLYGAAWGVGSTGVDRDLVISHAGSTHIYSSVVRILPERGLAVVLLANASNSRALIAVAKKMTERVMNALARGGLSLPLRQPSQEEDHQFKRR